MFSILKSKNIDYLRESDYRLSHVEEWCDRNIETLRAIVGDEELRRLDLSDDRLGRLLDRLGDDEKWMGFECDFLSQMVRSYSLDSVYKEDLSMSTVRLDSFNIPQHRKEDDFFRRGYSKQRRGDRPFCKAMMTTLENGNFPLTIQLLAGNESDDPNYLPAIKRVKEILGLQSRLYVADSKIGSYANRLALALSADSYLCPLNGKQCTQHQLLEYIEAIICISKKRKPHQSPSTFVSYRHTIFYDYSTSTSTSASIEASK